VSYTCASVAGTGWLTNSHAQFMLVLFCVSTVVVVVLLLDMLSITPSILAAAWCDFSSTSFCLSLVVVFAGTHVIVPVTQWLGCYNLISWTIFLALRNLLGQFLNTALISC
jgi:hypothetical protein